MILSSSLSHGKGDNYHFRVHKQKLETLCQDKFDRLISYLLRMRTECPNQYFVEGPRSSSLRIQIPVNIQKVTHEVAHLARMGLDSDYYNNAHMNVQMFMLSFDKKTLAIEIPIYLTCDELSCFRELFNSELALSGHIDLIRFENGKIWIWDYKPKARREKNAVTQIYFYALMLSKRTGLDISNFMCGYFDDLDVYVFDPSTANPELLVTPK
jgi:hypothetical protein